MTETHAGDTTARDRILEAAEGAFAERGFRGATIEAIASAAGVNRALLYYYFRSKEHIYECLVEKGVHTLQGILDALPGPETPVRSRLLPFIRAYIGLCSSDKPLARIIRREVIGGNVRRDLVADPFRHTAERVAGLIAEATASGELRSLDAVTTAYSLLGMMNVFHDVTLLAHAPIDVEAAAEHTLTLFLGGAAAGADGPRGTG